MSDLSIPVIEYLEVHPECKLRCHPPAMTLLTRAEHSEFNVQALSNACQNSSNTSNSDTTSQVKVDTIEIHTSLTIDTLHFLLTHIHTNDLRFQSDCRVLDMDNYQRVNQVNDLEAMFCDIVHLSALFYNHDYI